MKRTGSRVATLLLALTVGRGAFAQATDPVLLFSDLTSGPSTGNGDDSGGRVAGRDGAIVTVWGRNLGGSLSSVNVTCNGAAAGSYYGLSDAISPANLSAYHRMQKLTFQVGQGALVGEGQITVSVNGRTSNPLPFTVRSGRILFVKTTGNDGTGDGSWSAPWRTIPTAVNSLAPGDIAYVCDGVDQTEPTDFDAAVNLGSDGEAGRPKALVVYPGARSRVGSATVQRAFHAYNAARDGPSAYWTVSGFTVTTAGVGLNAQAGFRLVGNSVTAPQGDGMDGVIAVWGSEVAVLGNEVFGAGAEQSSKLYHVVYVSGVRQGMPPCPPTERNREVGWNYLHDYNTNRAINVYSEEDASAFLERHTIHDNVIVNQRGDGILLGYYVTGENWITNNLVVRAGGGPEWPDDASSHSGIRIDAGHESVPVTTVHVVNNTVYGCGYSAAAGREESGHLYVSPEALSRGTTVRFENNVVVSTGEAYVASASGAIPSGGYRNCWYGSGAAPAWDTAAIASDPAFANAASNDFQLASGSPCLDAGLDQTAIAPRDLLGVARPQGAAFDLGAYERVAPPAPCVPGGGVLCLNAGRFKATVSFRNQYDGGSTGSGTASALTSDTGTFWFFSPSNLELIVKVLDGRNVNGKFWVFYGALSDVEYTLTLLDTITAAARTYHNPAGSLASLADVNAFTP